MSDDDYWKDFSRQIRSFTPRLLPLNARVDQRIERSSFDATWFVGTQRWQVLRSNEPGSEILAPYDRSVQVGVGLDSELPLGMRFDVESEVNRFTRADGLPNTAFPNGWRAHAVASVSRLFETPAFYVRPKVTVNSASYSLDQPMVDGSTRASRTVPTFSIDTGAVFERDSNWFGRAQLQTLEPRLFYVNTPFRDQSTLPNFDSGPIDFNTISVYIGEPVLGLRPGVRWASADGGCNHPLAGREHRGRDAAAGHRAALPLPRPARHARWTAADAAAVRRAARRLDVAGAQLALRCGDAVQRRVEPRGALDRRRAIPAGAVPRVERHLPPGARVLGAG